MQGITLFLWIVFSIGVWILYHKIFTVYYFSLSQGLMKEFLISAFVGMLLTELTLYFWWLSAIILLLVGVGASGKAESPTGKKTVMAVFVAAAVIVAIVGIYSKSQTNSPDASASGYKIEEATDRTI